MTPERMDVLATRSYERNGEKKTAYTRIGTAWATKNGGYRIIFEALPLPQLTDKGTVETMVLMVPPREEGQREAAPPQQRGAPAARQSFSPSFDGDEVPFSPEMRG